MRAHDAGPRLLHGAVDARQLDVLVVATLEVRRQRVAELLVDDRLPEVVHLELGGASRALDHGVPVRADLD
jgi:hypothetical protein